MVSLILALQKVKFASHIPQAGLNLHTGLSSSVNVLAHGQIKLIFELSPDHKHPGILTCIKEMGIEFDSFL
jgi:hypothetical protein